MRTYRLGLAQVNQTVGDLSGNLERIREQLHAGRAAGCTIVAFPELAITGYPPEDLLLRRAFCEASRDAVTGSKRESGREIGVIGSSRPQ